MCGTLSVADDTVVKLCPGVKRGVVSARGVGGLYRRFVGENRVMLLVGVVASVVHTLGRSFSNLIIEILYYY